MRRGIYTIPPGVSFADTLARGLVEELDATNDPLALAAATIYLPTRRSARVLGESFARRLAGAALLPDIRPLGDVDEEEILFDPWADDLFFPPAIHPIRRRLLLATLVRRWAEQSRDMPPGFAQAAAMARHLARFLDEAETQNADLGALETLAPEPLASHWAQAREFLIWLRAEWPKLLAAVQAVDSATRRNLLLGELARQYSDKPPKAPVIAAGTTGSIPATADLLRLIATLPQGAVVLPGLDRVLDDESWGRLDPGHPQYGMKQLLDRMNLCRDDVLDWPGAGAGSDARIALLREALRPAPTTDAWRALAERGSDRMAQGLEGIGIVEAAHPGEEALAIALMLREAVEQGGKTGALVTPDRGLARRVAAELARWEIAIDDSAGTPLVQTPPAVFLSLLAEAAAAEFAPVPLLALLKHPLAACGERPSDFRRRARLLDRYVLRGPRPDPGLAGIAKAIAARCDAAENSHTPIFRELDEWFAGIKNLLGPFANAMTSRSASLPELVALHRATAECLAATDSEEGSERLWRGNDGNAAAELLETLWRASEDLPLVESSAYPRLFRQLADENAIRPAYGRHPRLAILGPLEARLQQFDLVVLGGLNEGAWPHSAVADPWLSRPMREKLGLESPERAIGLAAHDFASLAAQPCVRLVRSLKVDGTPTVASRWLQRLQQLARGLKLEDQLKATQTYADYAALLAAPDRAPVPAPRPAPRPPLSKRPRELSVTEIETWLRDPYAIYAKHVLRLAPLEALDAEIGPLDRGRAMHEILERFIRECAERLPPHPLARLIGISEEVFASHGVPQVTLAVWRPRFARAAQWFVEDEQKRRPEILRSFLEVKGRIEIEAPGGRFILKGRADRIDSLRAGGGAIIDYKTGNPPSDSQVGVLAPQLPLEGAILEDGGFENVGALAAARLVYIRFSGGDVAGETRVVTGNARERVAKTRADLLRWIADFDRVDTPYLSRIAPFRTDSAGDYDHLARVREWSISGLDET